MGLDIALFFKLKYFKCIALWKLLYIPFFLGYVYIRIWVSYQYV